MEKWYEDVDRRLNYTIGVALDLHIVKPKDNIIVLTGSKAGEGNTCTVRVLQVPSALPIHILNPMAQRSDHSM